MLTSPLAQDPHLLNLNEDQLMTEKLLYFLHAGVNKIGRIDADDEQSIVIGGLGILKEHCVIRVQKHEAAQAIAATDTESEAETAPSLPLSTDVLTIRANPGAKVYVNATLLKETDDVELRHCDRLILGNNNVFRVRASLVVRALVAADVLTVYGSVGRRAIESQSRLRERRGTCDRVAVRLAARDEGAQ